MKNPHPPPLRLATLALSLGAMSLWAQEGPVRPAEDPDRNEDVVTLQEFTVTSSAVSEYVASESITGTRIASKIQELPFAVNVVTSEFIDDFNALEFGEKFAYTSSVVAYETISTGYNVRGFEANVQLRNGFRRIGLIDKVSVDRAEVIKGPAASIYGITLPGGIVNIITKKPKTKPEYRIGFTAGTNELLRAQASATGPVGDSNKFFYRVDLAAENRGYDMPYKKKEQMTGSVQLLWKPAPATSLLFEVERLVRNEQGNANVPFAVTTGVADPYTTTARTYTRYDRIATELIDFNVQGPLNYSDRFVNTITGTLEHRINSTFSFRSSANWYDRNLERQEVAGRIQYNPATQRIVGSSDVPRLRPYGEGGAGWQNDLLASFSTGPVNHKLLVTLDWQMQSEQPAQLDGSAGSFPSDSTVLAQGINPSNPDYRFLTFREAPTTYRARQNEDNKLNVYGIFVSERATMLDGRLVLLAGARYDYVRNHSRTLPLFNRSDAQNAAYVQDVRVNADAYTYQTGLNFHVTKSLTAYANASTSFVPHYGFGTDPDGNIFTLPNEDGKGWETGFKGSLFDGKFTFTAGYFDITLNNIVTDSVDAETLAITTMISDQRAKGYELDFNWVLTSELQLFGGYGNTDAKILRNPFLRFLEGTGTRRTPEHTLGLGAKYDFKTGPLKGLFFTAGYKYNSESLVNPTGRQIRPSTPTASQPLRTIGVINARHANGQLFFPDQPENAVVTLRRGTDPATGVTYDDAVRVADGRESITNDAYSVVDFGFGYKWRVNRRYNHRVQFNATNIFDEIYTFGSAGQGQRTGFSLTYDLRF